MPKGLFAFLGFTTMNLPGSLIQRESGSMFPHRHSHENQLQEGSPPQAVQAKFLPQVLYSTFVGWLRAHGFKPSHPDFA